MGASIERKTGYTEGFEAGVGACLQGLVVGPDDQLVIQMPASADQADLESVLRTIDKSEKWHGRILVVAGAEGLAVLKGGASDG